MKSSLAADSGRIPGCHFSVGSVKKKPQIKFIYARRANTIKRVATQQERRQILKNPFYRSASCMVDGSTLLLRFANTCLVCCTSEKLLSSFAKLTSISVPFLIWTSPAPTVWKNTSEAAVTGLPVEVWLKWSSKFGKFFLKLRFCFSFFSALFLHLFFVFFLWLNFSFLSSFIYLSK